MSISGGTFTYYHKEPRQVYPCPFYKVHAWVSGGYQAGITSVSPEYISIEKCML
jgi:hypothetical protein